jgi:hypothetical protein
MSAQVDAILQQIENLDAKSRKLLDERLRQMAEDEWQREANSARATAIAQGIDQSAIDDAIEDLRYGS